MNDYDQMQPRDAFFSKKIRAGKRTYYFDVKATRGNDYYITITESKRKPGDSDAQPFFEKHKLFLYKEDFEKFTDGLQEALEYIREKRTAEGGAPNYDHTYAAEPVKTGYTDIEFDDLDK